MNNLLKYFAYLKEIFKGRLTHRNIPIFVVICLSNRCNLRCRYCYGEYYDRNHKEFSTQEVLDLIDELVAMGTKYISLNGGEPLLRRDAEIIVDRIKQKNILCHLSTNGLLIKNNIALLKKIDSLAISLDGCRQSHDINRGQGTYDKIIEAFECLNRNGIKFHTHTVLTSNNKNAVDEVLHLAHRYCFSAQFSPLRVQDSPDRQIMLDSDELRAVTMKIIGLKKAGFPVFFPSAVYENLLNWPFSYDKEMIFEETDTIPGTATCYLKRFSCHIEANGMVYPCIPLVNKFKSLNFLEVGFNKAWENLANNNECKGCYNICSNSQNSIFALMPSALWNAFKIVADRQC